MKLVTPEDDEDDELQTISSPVSTDTTSKTEVDLNGESLTLSHALCLTVTNPSMCDAGFVLNKFMNSQWRVYIATSLHLYMHY